MPSVAVAIDPLSVDAVDPFGEDAFPASFDGFGDSFAADADGGFTPVPYNASPAVDVVRAACVSQPPSLPRTPPTSRLASVHVLAHAKRESAESQQCRA